MMKTLIKNIEHNTALPLAQQVQYLNGQIVSKTLVQSQAHSMTLFAFDKDEEISSHDSDGDAMVLALDGKAIITIDGAEHNLSCGETIIMPAKIPHAIYAKERFKMLLIVIFPETIK